MSLQMIKWTNVQNSFDVAIDCRVIKKQKVVL